MKTVKIIATVAALVLVGNHLQAQIVIENSLTESMFAEGSVSSFHFADSWDLSSFNSQIGDNQNWDFSSVTWPDSAAYTLSARNYPSGTLLENESYFLPTTYTMSSSINVQGVELKTDQYFLVTSGAIEFLGTAQNSDFDGDGDLEIGSIYHTPGTVVMSFPIEMGTLWSTENATTISANGSEVEDLGERTSHSITSWGQANANGITADCLRDDFKTEFACASGVGYCGESDQIVLYCVPQSDGPLYFYILSAELNTDGTVADLSLWTFDSSLILSSSENTPTVLSNFNSFPNPFSHSLSLQLDVEKQGYLEINVLDIMGRMVDVVSSQSTTSGPRSFSWNPSQELPNGTYIVEMRLNEISSYQKVVLAR